MDKPIRSNRIYNDVYGKIFESDDGYTWTIENDFEIMVMGTGTDIEDCERQIDDESYRAY